MKLLIWDFDATLAYREAMWSGTLAALAKAAVPGLSVTRDEIHPFMTSGFPWHTPEVAHPEIASADEWWEALTPLFANALIGVGVESAVAWSLANKVRGAYCDPDGWALFEDTLPTLQALSSQGWKHCILSNHVPELPDLVDALGLADIIDEIHNSAQTGYEKPHPEAYRRILRGLPAEAEVWMIGDNPTADVEGAERCGIPAILVRKEHSSVKRFAASLAEVPALLEREGQG